MNWWRSLQLEHIPTGRRAKEPIEITPRKSESLPRRFFPKEEKRRHWLTLGLHTNPTFPMHLPEVQAYLRMTMEDREYTDSEVTQIFQSSIEATHKYAAEWNIVVRVPHGNDHGRQRHMLIQRLFKLCS